MKVKLTEDALRQIISETINKVVLNEKLGTWNPSPNERERLEKQKQEYEQKHPGAIDGYIRLKKETEKIQDKLKKSQDRLTEFIRNNCLIRDGWNPEWFYKEGETVDLG